MKSVKSLLPNSFKHALKKALFQQEMGGTRQVYTVPPYPAMQAILEDRPNNCLPFDTPPTYAQDSLISWHNVEFMQEPRFKRAYDLGKATNSWQGPDIQWRFHVLCWAAYRAAKLEGDFVECGVNRGAFSRAVIDYVDFQRLPKTFYLMDTFNGLIEALITPEEKKLGITRDIHGGYVDCYEAVVATFKPFSNVKIIRGAILDTLSAVDCQKICYLSIDMNCTQPEIAAAEYFWPKLVSGAVIILDDYGHTIHKIQKHAFDKFAAERGVQVLMLPTGQGLLFKGF